MCSFMQDPVLSEGERYINKSAALALCDLIELEKGEWFSLI